MERFMSAEVTSILITFSYLHLLGGIIGGTGLLGKPPLLATPFFPCLLVESGIKVVESSHGHFFLHSNVIFRSGFSQAATSNKQSLPYVLLFDPQTGWFING